MRLHPLWHWGGDDLFDLAFDANQLLENKWFQKILSVHKIDQFLRHGEAIPSVPKNLIPKRIPFYFNFLPRMQVDDLDSEQKIKAFRDQLQTLLYAEIDHLKAYRKLQHSK